MCNTRRIAYWNAIKDIKTTLTNFYSITRYYRILAKILDSLPCGYKHVNHYIWNKKMFVLWCIQFVTVGIKGFHWCTIKLFLCDRAFCQKTRCFYLNKWIFKNVFLSLNEIKVNPFGIIILEPKSWFEKMYWNHINRTAIITMFNRK